MGCAPDMELLLKWAELQTSEIRNDELHDAARHPKIAQLGAQGLATARPDVLSHHL